ncbi:uncharacterized protein DUF4085 [Ureibacillus xyleni]|uniref:Uncharacterized protein DUF4085 n=1 Tax=Ureibacillus xyleni TaxID=614648 RepID=A0A285TVC7_9BACL|nr:DUF4085 family protein [Ureibacillus xyleni]SOC27523.1 uncharacterized protein DUF4085 [Ureibacillus xyleni]
MKYFTKDWYELCQKTSFHLLLEEDPQAQHFSEEYFQQLYNAELHRWLDTQEEIHHCLVTEYGHKETFDRDKEKEQFHDVLLYNLAHFKRGLPETILNQIADLRVFALNKASRDVLDAVTKFCEENDRIIDKVSGDFRKYYQEASKSISKEIVENFAFHDCIVIKVVQNGNSLTLHLDTSGGFTDINEITFENMNILKQDDVLEEAWWLYEEVYKVEDKYEFHVLLQNKNMELIDFIISADRFTFLRGH